MRDELVVPARRRHRVVWIVVLTGLLVAVLASVLALRLLPNVIRSGIVSEARARGAVLEFSDFNLSPTRFWPIGIELSLLRAKLGLARSPHVTAELPRLTLGIGLAGFSDLVLETVDASGAKITLRGALLDLMADLQSLDSLPAAADLPMHADNAHFVWLTASGAPALSIDGATIELEPSATVRVSAPRGELFRQPLERITGSLSKSSLKGEAHVGGAPVGGTPLGGTPLEGKRDGLTVSFEMTDQSRVTLRADTTDVKALLLRIALPELAANLPTNPVAVRFNLVADRKADKWHGQAAARLPGFVPPHPIELNGFDFGDSTHVALRFDTAPPFQQLELSRIALDAGALHLGGTGRLQRLAQGSLLEHIVFHVDLSGALACSDVAASAIRARYDTVFGRFFAKAARQTLRGSVGVRVVTDARWPAISAPVVNRSISAGCGIRPLSDIEFRKLAQALPGLDEAWPALSETLRGMPLPELGKLPTLDLPEWVIP